jgi:hypothetical protein
VTIGPDFGQRNGLADERIAGRRIAIRIVTNRLPSRPIAMRPPSFACRVRGRSGLARKQVRLGTENDDHIFKCSSGFIQPRFGDNDVAVLLADRLAISEKDPVSGTESPPDLSEKRIVPGFSVIRSLPSGRNAKLHG